MSSVRDRIPDAPRRWIVRSLVFVLVVSLVATTGVLSLGYDRPTLGQGAVVERANTTTVVGIQGFHHEGSGSTKKPSRIAAAAPDGTVEWVYNGTENDQSWWIYDVDPLPNGNLLVVNTVPGATNVYELDTDTMEKVWSERFEMKDTHDVDLINGDELLIADKDHDKVLVYNRTRGEYVWEFDFEKQMGDVAGGPSDDWTHVNDVDKIGDGRYLVSPRNFDQVIVVDRETKEIEMRLGEDGELDTLHEQHNPTYLESENGTPTLLVADSENDRVVEYAREDGEWTKVWEVRGHRLNWPRDADRLPNGNTLVVDTLNHRVIEITPTGDVVWEFKASWGPYDAERVSFGDEPGGPTMRDLNASGTYRLPGTGSLAFPAWLDKTFSGTSMADQAEWFARKWKHVTPWVKPVWMAPWGFVALVLAALLTLSWGVGEAVYHRRTIARGVRRGVARVRARL